MPFDTRERCIDRWFSPPSLRYGDAVSTQLSVRFSGSLLANLIVHEISIDTGRTGVLLENWRWCLVVDWGRIVG